MKQENKHTAMTQATREALTDAFCKIYRDKPIEKITVQEIVDRAGYHRGTFYHHFKDVYDLLTELENRFITDVQDKIAKNISRGDASDIIITALLDMRQDEESYGMTLLCNPGSAQFYGRLKSKMLPFFMARLSIPETDTKSVYVLDFYLSGLTAIVHRWLVSGQAVPTEEITRIVRALLAEGVLASLDRPITLLG